MSTTLQNETNCNPLCNVVRRQEIHTHTHLALVDVVRSEEELPVQVGLVDRVQVHHLDVLETGLHQVLQQLATLPVDVASLTTKTKTDYRWMWRLVRMFEVWDKRKAGQCT